ncbi:MAG: AI-2E family transporter [Candidatus Cryptobacteroides sp.]
MEQERNVDRLARYVIHGVALAAVLALCWYLRSILVYVILAAVVSLLCKPVMSTLGRIRIRKKPLPPALLAVCSLLFVMTVFLFIVTQIIPVTSNIVSTIFDNLARSDYSLPVDAFKIFVADINSWMREHFSSLGPDFRIEAVLGKFLKTTMGSMSVSSVVEHLASFLVSVGVGIFSVVFISFFFIKDSTLFGRIVSSFVPDDMESSVVEAISDIEYLLSRYFTGLMIEVLGVALLNFLGLWTITGIGFSSAVGIAFITGIMNVIPYVGPLVGGLIGTVLAVVLKFSAAGTAMSFWGFILVVVLIFVVTQLIDNFLYQPLIYSASIKASPLEIFIVLLVAGNVAGMLGMLVAIPAYTVVRVVASRFFMNYKPVRRLMGEEH